MKRIILLILITFAGYAVGAGGNLSTARGAGDEFVPLFNGTSLEGWINVNCGPETWQVKDGMIICSGFPTGVLRTVKQYENYVLELEFRHQKKGGNAGLFVHSEPISSRGQPFTRAIEVQIMDSNEGDIFAIHGATLQPFMPHPRWEGAMRSLPVENAMKPTGQWNKYRVESRDGTLILSVNGRPVTRAYHCNPRKGYICLESEGSEIHFRNIRIRELPSSNPPAEVVAGTCRGFHSLFNGLDLRGWKQDPGHKGHWQANDWILNYDGKSQAEDKALWSEKEYGDFILIVDWRQPASSKYDNVPIVLPDGSVAVDNEGRDIMVPVLDGGDSGIYLRGSPKSQLNIWNWPVGSGEIYGYRTDQKMSAEVRRGATPLQKADNKLGEWNRFEITAKGDRVTVVLNGKTVIKDARLPGLPKKGPIGLQHHGDLIQFANIYIKELD
jgi:3-keto-disaccharide hydrolase